MWECVTKMARPDSLGMFWEDHAKIKPLKKEKPKSIPPDPVWLLPEYLPGLEEARAMKPNLFTDDELVAAQQAGERFSWDIECYPNYFLVAFKSINSGKVIYFENGYSYQLDIGKLKWVLNNFILVDYNGNKYDIPIVTLALDGATSEDLFTATEMIIIQGMRPRDVLRTYKLKKIKLNHIDLIELVALSPSLKLLSGRLHAPRMQDLPFAPGTVLTKDQITITRWYCINDLDNTQLLYEELLPDILLREKMSIRYGVDLRSHSDAQIAESVISSEIRRITGQKYLRAPDLPENISYKYQVPAFLNYSTPLLEWVLDTVKQSDFRVHESGAIIMPKELRSIKITLASGTYQMGIGGLHSNEKTSCHIADENTILCDRDVASYYPRIILNEKLAPSHLGNSFLVVYNNLVEERLNSKRQGDKATSDSLKIVVNGSFGKLGNKYSSLYSPNLLIQVTITGQLTLLMLIERLELANYQIVSANTDGIIIKCSKDREISMNQIITQWEKDTGFETESTYYKAIFSRDVNNYFAVKENGNSSARFLDDKFGVKVKGIYAERGSSRNSILSKNPMATICSDAVLATITTGVAIEDTIRNCRDIRRFVSVRTVRGGAVKDGVFLGKAIRWYYAIGVEGVIVYAKSGNKVPRSDGAKPLMQLPEFFPNDINYEWYEKETTKILIEIGFLKSEKIEENQEVDENDDEGSNKYL